MCSGHHVLQGRVDIPDVMHNVARFAGSFGARPTIVLTKFVPLSYHPFSGISAVISNMRRSSLCTDTTTISLSSNVVNVTTAPRGTAFRRRSKTRCFGFSAILASAAAPTVYQYPQLLTSPLQHTLRPTEDALVSTLPVLLTLSSSSHCKVVPQDRFRPSARYQPSPRLLATILCRVSQLPN